MINNGSNRLDYPLSMIYIFHIIKSEMLSQFISKHIEEAYLDVSKTKRRNVILTMDVIYPVYKTWFRQNYPNSSMECKRIIRNSLIQVWGNTINDGWIGIVIKNDLVLNNLG